MKNIKVKNLFNTPLWLCSNAIRMSHDNHNLSDTKIINGLPYEVDENELVTDVIMKDEDMQKYSRIGKKDLALINRVGNKLKHQSVLEMIQMYWEIDGISRGCLLEYSRHRMQSLTVKSSRYVLHKDLKDEKPFVITSPFYMDEHKNTIKRASKYIVLTDNIYIDYFSIKTLDNLRFVLNKKNISNDIAKYNLCECYRTKLQTSMNMRAFQNFLQLRLHKDAHFEIRLLAEKMLNGLPKEYKDIALGYKDN